jgi:DNA invertase Pin-like site-specific DNA recombinase
MTTAAAIYCRISQARDGTDLGVERQRADCIALAERRGLDVREVYVENDTSAHNGKARKEWRRMLEDVRAGRASSVIAYANDRLYRSVRDQLELMEAVAASGGLIATILDGDVNPGTAEGRMRMGILANVAAFESDRKSERQERAYRERAVAGKTNGGGMRPYGYTEGGLEIEPTEAEYLREAARRVIAGESTYEIAGDFRDRGIRTSSGVEWTHRSLRRTLTLPRIAGLRAFDGQLYDAVWPAVLPRRTWDAVQRRLAVRHPARRRVGRGTYLLTGLMHCGRCGYPMRGHPVHGKRSYGCLKEGGVGGCGRMRIVAEPTEAIIAEAVFAAIDGGAMNRALAAASKDVAGAEVVEQIAADRAALDELAKDHYVERTISKSEFIAARGELADRIAKAEQALSRSEDTAVLAGVSSGEVARAAWAERDQDWRRELLSALLERIEIAPAKEPKFEADRISLVWKA